MYPPQNGAEVRLAKTAEKLADVGDLWVASPPAAGEPPNGVAMIELTSPLWTYQPVWNELWTGLFALSQRHPLRGPLADAIVKAVERTDVAFDIIVCEFPQVTDAARRLAEAHDAKLLLNKHNADHEMLGSVLRERGVPAMVRRRAVGNFRAFETAALDAADAVVFQSVDDREQFEIPGGTDSFVIPNGCDFDWISEGGDPEAAAEECGVSGDRFTCVFLGSYDYAPNHSAATLIDEEIAPALPDIDFLLLGRNPPSLSEPTVYTPGYVDELAGALQLADVALCPLFSGSGTKLKMLDYFAAGLPVVSTPVGVQGLLVAPGEDVLVYDSATGFVDGIERLQSSAALRRRLGSAGRDIAAGHSWKSLMAEYDPVFEALLETQTA